jgi:hypothetical protein
MDMPGTKSTGRIARKDYIWIEAPRRVDNTCAVAFEHTQALPTLDIPNPDCAIMRSRKGAALIGAPRTNAAP